jgi:hypothetical protein
MKAFLLAMAFGLSALTSFAQEELKWLTPATPIRLTVGPDGLATFRLRVFFQAAKRSQVNLPSVGFIQGGTATRPTDAFNPPAYWRTPATTPFGPTTVVDWTVTYRNQVPGTRQVFLLFQYYDGQPSTPIHSVALIQ